MKDIVKIISANAVKKGNLAAAILILYLFIISLTEPFFAQNSKNEFSLCTPPDGITIDSMESIGNWHELLGDSAVYCSLASVDGYKNKAIKLSYNLGSSKGAWVQIRCDFNTPINISEGDHIRFYYKGSAKNTLEIGLVSADGQNYFAGGWNCVTGMQKFTYATWDFKDFRKEGQPFPDFSHVKAIFISAANKNINDTGGEGYLIIDELQYHNIASRTVFLEPENIIPDTSVTIKAAGFISGQMQEDSLLKSWKEEEADIAWLYDQAIGLIVLTETDPAAAEKLADKLIRLQNPSGSWYAGYHYTNSNPVSLDEPLGAIAWTVYGLTYYYWCSSNNSARISAGKAAAWIASLQRENGSLPSESDSPEDDAPTETNLDCWWAFHCTGNDSNAAKLKDFLLNNIWDNETGRFRSGPNYYHIFLDNQTWGAAFLYANGRDEDARRALSYAYYNLITQSYSGSDTICGFDGAGPFNIWNEGTFQYIAAGGEHSQYLWDQIIKQQASDGGMPGSTDSLSAYIVWLTKWHGIAPASWLYFAGTGGPFRDTCRIIDTEVKPVNAEKLESYFLFQNYPNPFNPGTKMNFAVPERSRVRLTIYDILGKEIIILEDAQLPRGQYEKSWSGKDSYGKEVSSGIYLCRFYAKGESGKEYSKIMKMMLLK